MNFKDYITKKKFTKTLDTDNQAVAKIIYEGFKDKKRVPFGSIIGLITRKGKQAVLEIYNETIKSDCRDRISLFFYKLGENKVKF